MYIIYVHVSVHEILSLIACAMTQISLCIFKVSPELSLWGGGGVLEVRNWSGVGVNVLVCTRGAAFEMDWWWFGVFQ